MKTRILHLIKTIFIVLIISAPSISIGQEATIPFCNGISIIDSQLSTKVSRFKDYTAFQQATLQQTEQGMELNIVYKLDGIFKVDKFIITQAELDEICAELTTNISNTGFAEENPSQEARRRFIVSSSAFSLGYYSWAIPTAFKSDDYKAYVASYMIIGGSGFFVPLLATNKRDITDGMERAYTMGALNGLAHGVSLNMLLLGEENSSFETILGFSSAVSITESLLALSLAKKHKITWGYSSIVGTGGLWGTAYGAAIPYLISGSENIRLYGATTLLGSAGGILAANYLYNRQPITHGDASIISSLGTLGTYWGAVLMESFEVGNDQVIIGLLTAGATGGLAWGVSKTKGYNYTRQQGNLIPLGAFAGGLIGGGIAVLVEAEGTGSLWLTALGATGGFLISDRVLRGNQKEKSSQASNFNFQINPMGVMGAFNNNYLPKTNDPRFVNSIANFRLTF